MKEISLTGIKPTGDLHVGNYFGAIKPALELAQRYDARYFVADYHALNAMKDPAELRSAARPVAAGWLAAGLDPEKAIFYRQGAVPEIFELAIMLMAFTSKGLMNRAHAYKDAAQKNAEKGNAQDEGVNMGLFTYPVLMAADIVAFDADVVPVGQDQLQHVEMAQDIAQSVNANYGKPVLKVPRPEVKKEVAVVPGLDGRKMSKSYGNTIPLFVPEKTLRKTIMRIVTNSQASRSRRIRTRARFFFCIGFSRPRRSRTRSPPVTALAAWAGARPRRSFSAWLIAPSPRCASATTRSWRTFPRWTERSRKARKKRAQSPLPRWSASGRRRAWIEGGARYALFAWQSATPP